MKRSKAVRILYNAINSHCDVEMDYHVSLEAIKEGLNALEEAGMLPPGHNVCILTGKPNKLGSVIKYAWEEENEE